MDLHPLRPLLMAVASLAAPVQAGVTIAPRHPILLDGQALAFTAREQDAGPVPCRWTVVGQGARIGPDGRFTGTPGQYRVLATSLADPSASDGTTVLVLPDLHVFRTVAQVLGPGVLESRWSDALPFRDLDGPGRFGDPQARVTELQASGYAEQQVVGYGLKVPVTWPRQGLLPDALLLSFLESGEPVRMDVTGSHFGEVQVRGAVTQAQLEALNQSAPNLWLSRVQKLRIKVRGLVPLAGNPVTEPGDADGNWLSARFRRPVGLAMLSTGVLVAADSEAHVLRAISPDRRVATLWGAAGTPGHQDGGPDQTRFRAPTFVATRPAPADSGTWLAMPGFLVSDSGNHVIRAVDALGRVTTLAGGPGERGHVDSPDPRLARFDDPQGLAVDSEGHVFVADRGNHVVRVISPESGVTTLAGLPGTPGSQDGFGPGARFRDLRGLAIGRPIEGILTSTLYVVDGHSVRRVNPDGAVSTLCGDPAVAGSPGPRFPVPRAGVPCLDRPHGIVVIWPWIVIADRGNHAIQALRPGLAGRAELATLAGGRELPGTRFGLLRCGIRGPLGPEYGSLEDPMGVAADPWGDLYIADARCVVHASEPLPPGGLAGPELDLRPGGKACSGLALEVGFTGPRALDPDDAPDLPPHFFWKMECFDAASGKRVAGPATGEERGRTRGTARVTLPKAGQVDVRFTCVTADGWSTQDEVRVQVD